MTTYSVTVTRETDTWTADIAELPGTRPHQVSHDSFLALHDQIPQMIADAAGVESADVEVDYRYEISGHDVTEEFARLKQDLPSGRRYARTMRDNPSLIDETFVKNIEMFGRRHEVGG